MELKETWNGLITEQNRENLDKGPKIKLENNLEEAGHEMWEGTKRNR